MARGGARLTGQDVRSIQVIGCSKCGADRRSPCKNRSTCLERRAEAIQVLAGRGSPYQPDLNPHDEESTLP